MKKIIKFILFFILIIVLIVVGAVVALYISLKNETDETPTALYTAEANKQDIISATLSNGFDMSEKDYIDITLNETELNILIFCLIREKLNNQYLPLPKEDADYTNPINYVWASNLDSSIPVVGGKGITIKSAYAKIDGEELKLFMPAIVAGRVSCVEVYLSFEEDNESFNMKIDTLKIGKTNYASKGSKKVIKLLSKVGLSDEKLSNTLSGEDLKVNVNLENLKIGITKDSLQTFLANLITKNVTSSEVTQSTLVSLANMITSKENDMLDLGIFNDRFGIRCDMSKADVDEEQLLLNLDYANFDDDVYMHTITQTFAINNLASSDKKITISEEDFNAMVYTKSNGYHDFKVEFPIPGSSTSIKLAVNQIDVDLDDENVLISIILNLNGLKTVIEVSGKVSGNGTERIVIKLDEEIKIGRGNSEVTATYIKASSDFINVLLAEKISEIEMMDFDKEQNALVLSADNFNEMLRVSGGSVLPMAVNKLSLTDAGLDVYVTITNPVVAASLATVTNAISDYLENSTLTASDFNTTDPEQASAVNNVLDLINASGNAISSGELTESDTNSLVEAINSLSDANKETLYNSIEDSMITNDLVDLYGSLFGK